MARMGTPPKKSVLFGGVEHWRCPKCELYAPSSFFHRDASKKNGLRATCKKCVSVYNSVHNPQYRADNPEKIKAHNAVNNAIAAGTLKRGNCERCGSADAHAHHEDYSKPLVVDWLCRKHHNELHAELDHG